MPPLTHPAPLTESASTKTALISETAIKRADRALRCSGFTPQLFATMLSQSVALGAIAQGTTSEHPYLAQPMGLTQVDQQLRWLIKVGILRREVDGQGITDSFRLTPLGRAVIESRQAESTPWQIPNLRERLSDWTTRWLNLSWL